MDTKNRIPLGSAVPCYFKKDRYYLIYRKPFPRAFAMLAYENVSKSKKDFQESVVFLPKMLQEMSQDAITYMFPGVVYSITDIENTFDDLYSHLSSPSSVGLVCHEDDGNWYIPLDLNVTFLSEKELESELGKYSISRKNIPSFDFLPDEIILESQVSKYFEFEELDSSCDIRFRVTEPQKESCGALLNKELPSQKKNTREAKKTKKQEKSVDAVGAMPAPPSKTIELPPDEADETRKRKILKELERIQEKYGITIQELEILLNYKVKLSRLYITDAGKFILADFNNTEVKMDILSKAVYLLFLKHPEGIRFKELQDYRDELFDIYCKISNKDDMEEMARVIDHLVDPFNSNQISILCSRIKRAFTIAQNEKVAKFYYVQGQQGEAKKIAISRDYVFWRYL